MERINKKELIKSAGELVRFKMTDDHKSMAFVKGQLRMMARSSQNNKINESVENFIHAVEIEMVAPERLGEIVTSFKSYVESVDVYLVEDNQKAIDSVNRGNFKDRNYLKVADESTLKTTSPRASKKLQNLQ